MLLGPGELFAAAAAAAVMMTPSPHKEVTMQKAKEQCLKSGHALNRRSHPKRPCWKTAEILVGPKNCSQEGNNGQLPGVPTGGANLSRGDDLQSRMSSEVETHS